MRSILTLARKDLRVLTRVKAGVFFTFIWPIIVAILFGTAFGGRGTDAPAALQVAVVDYVGKIGSGDFLYVVSFFFVL
jgi:ABC-type transport system involved in cytochrome c biogenesis permease component